MIDRSEEQELAYDHLDNMGQFDAATIREMSGYESDGSSEDFSVDAITARAGGELALKAMAANFRGNPKYGLNKSAWANQSPAQKAINSEGLRKVREANQLGSEAR